MSTISKGLIVTVSAILVASPAYAAQPSGAAAPTQSQSQAAPTAPTAPIAGPVDSSYVLGVGDSVEISLVGRSEFNSRARVAMDGTILLPLIGRIKAADRNVVDLSDDIRQALIKGQFYSDPVVRADVVGISSRYATILGNVGQPGLLPLDRNYRLSEIIAKVGAHIGGGSTYVLLTRAGAEKADRYSLDKLAQGSDEQSDPIVKPGDKIYFPTAEAEVFYIQGEIKSPGAFPVSENLTFRQAIARGGGVTENGSENKITVTRDGKPVKVKLEDKVKVGDIIKIGERLF